MKKNKGFNHYCTKASKEHERINEYRTSLNDPILEFLGKLDTINIIEEPKKFKKLNVWGNRGKRFKEV